MHSTVTPCFGIKAFLQSPDVSQIGALLPTLHGLPPTRSVSPSMCRCLLMPCCPGPSLSVSVGLYRALLLSHSLHLPFGSSPCVDMYTYMFLHMYMYMYMYVCVYIYIYTYTYIHNFRSVSISSRISIFIRTPLSTFVSMD